MARITPFIPSAGRMHSLLHCIAVRQTIVFWRRPVNQTRDHSSLNTYYTGNQMIKLPLFTEVPPRKCVLGTK